jgi:hypothetical protein
MARYWLSTCDLGKALIAVSDLMAWPGHRKYNYTFRVFNEPIKSNAKRFSEIGDRESICEDISLERIIKVRTLNFLFLIK